MKPMNFGHLTRRTSFIAFFATGVAGIFARSQPGDAKQSVGKKAKNKCKKQEAQCVSSLTATCGGDLDCPALIQQCCAFTAQCDITGFFNCTEGFASR